MNTKKDLQNWLGKVTQRTLEAARCRTCEALVGVGLTGDIGAFRVLVDPTPLTPTGEVHALLDGLTTFTVTRSFSGGVQLNTRTAFRRTCPWPHDVWAEHRCGQIHTHTAPTSIAPRLRSTDDPDAPPPF